MQLPDGVGVSGRVCVLFVVSNCPLRISSIQVKVDISMCSVRLTAICLLVAPDFMGDF